MIPMLVILALVFCLQPSPAVAQKDQLRISIIEQLEVKRESGSKSPIDRRVIFSIRNTTDRKLFVYGNKQDYGVDPFAYRLSTDERTGKWIYPTRNQKPLAWSKDRVDKQVQQLNPGESLEFDVSFSTFFDAGKLYKITAYVAFKPDQKPFEIRSEEFVIK